MTSRSRHLAARQVALAYDVTYPRHPQQLRVPLADSDPQTS